MQQTRFFIISLLLLSNKLIDCSLRSNGKDERILTGKSCWMTLQAQNLCQNMDSIDDRYKTVRLQAVAEESMIFKNGLNSKGVAMREEFKVRHKGQIMLAGMNLGGYCMLRMDHSVLFFNRMKLRNDTEFYVDSYENDFKNMVINMDFSMTSLRLFGAYERSLTDKDPSVLIYQPTFGEVQFLLRSVVYKVQCPYRFVNDHIVIDTVRSQLSIDSVAMTFTNNEDQKPRDVPLEILGYFKDRLKADLDKWIRDYFNDISIYVTYNQGNIANMEKYDIERRNELSDWMDNAIQSMNKRILVEGVNNIRLPKFTIQSIQDGQKIKLYGGILRGLGTMHRRSIPTSFKENDTRKVDSLIGFSDLKVVYKYTTRLATGTPPMSGVLSLNANELTAHLAVDMMCDPEALALDIDFLDQAKPEALSVEGPANTIIANFKHILDQHITTVMTNTLNYGVKLMRSLPNCAPFIPNDIHRKPESFVSLPWDNEVSFSGKKKVYVSVENESSEDERSGKCVRWIDFFNGRCADNPERWFHKDNKQEKQSGNEPAICITESPNTLNGASPPDGDTPTNRAPFWLIPKVLDNVMKDTADENRLKMEIPYRPFIEN